MKKKFIILVCVLSFVLCGCFSSADSTNEKGKKTIEFNFGEIAKVNDTKITLNSVKKIEKECLYKWEGKCQSYTEPDNDYFLLIDLTIANDGKENLSISSLLSFDLKDNNGEKGSITYLLNSVKSQLDGDIVAGDKLKGQIAFDVKDSDVFYFYYRDGLLDSPVKFVINKGDIK